MSSARLVSFAVDDEAGLWRKGDAAVDLGWESLGPDGEPTTDVRLFKLLRSGETVSLSSPYERGLLDSTTLSNEELVNRLRGIVQMGVKVQRLDAAEPILAELRERLP